MGAETQHVHDMQSVRLWMLEKHLSNSSKVCYHVQIACGHSAELCFSTAIA